MLNELIDALTAELIKGDRVLPLGFHKPHSYRGYYDELAFEPTENIPLSAMLASAREARGSTYQGYKGGWYPMDGCTEVWMSEYGTTGESIGPILLRLILSQEAP